MVFMNVGEAGGLLSINDYPFGFGFGSPSKAAFGLAIPCSSNLVGYAISCSSTDSTRNISFAIEHYNTTNIKSSGDEIITLNSSNVFNSTVNKLYSAGNICVRVSSVSTLQNCIILSIICRIRLKNLITRIRQMFLI